MSRIFPPQQIGHDYVLMTSVAGPTRDLLLLLFCSILLSSCVSFGDRTRDVHVKNLTSEVVTVFAFDRDSRFAQTLGPSQEWRATWRYPLSAADRRRVLIEALGQDGRRIFCKRFGFADLERLGSRIELKPGVDECSPDPGE